MKKITVAVALCALVSACEPVTQSSDNIQNQQQERLSKQSVQDVGLPAIVNFQEKRILKDILELRDQPNLVTYTYITDMGGHLHKVCDSIGYGVPYATQYTNPQKLEWNSGAITMPQADPNGLFSPSSADGTWVLCRVPGKDDVKPVYIEPHIITSPFPLRV
jgi:hypothetical protein